MNTVCNKNECFVTPAVHVSEQPRGYEIVFEIPGVGKEDVDLHVDGRTLSLRTHAKPRENPAGFRVSVREFDPDRNYAVSLDLPELADLSTVRASVENGLLTVGVDKRPENQPRKIEVR